MKRKPLRDARGRFRRITAAEFFEAWGGFMEKARGQSIDAMVLPLLRGKFYVRPTR